MNPVNADRIMSFFIDNNLPVNSFIIELKVLLPGYQPDLGTYLKNLMGIKFEGGGITVPLPAEGFMNFGYIGIFLYSIIFAFILKFFELFILILNDSFIALLLLILLGIQFMGVITMGLSGILIKTTFPLVIVLITMLLVSYFLLIVKRNLINDRINYR